MTSRRVAVWSLVLSLAATNGGCSRPAPDGNDSAEQHQADPHDVPLTSEEIAQLREETASWSAAVARIQSYRDTIREETTGPEPHRAHRALDLLDQLLEWLPEIAQADNVPRQNWQTVGTNAQLLRDLFEEVHANIDADQPPEYEAVAAQIDQAIAELTEIQAGVTDE